MKLGFDNKKYVDIQSKKIRERFNLFDRLYLEIGGKLFDDSHASRVLPGFKSDAKISMFKELKKDLEIIFCINAGDIERNKIRGEYGISYDNEVIKLINKSKKMGFSVNSVVVTLYKNQVSVDKFIKKLERNGIKTYVHTFTKGYPTDVDMIVSDEGYGANSYIETTKPLVLVNAPGPGSGKLATCLSQIYHENKRGVNAGYAKFETFPVWNLSLKHPVNLAYEAATADLKDFNMIDPFHLEEYGEMAVNYNRDVEMFPVLKSILFKATGRDIYKSPTDMGVNMVGNCIIDKEIVDEASKKEIVRRYYNEKNNYKLGLSDEESSKRIKLLMNELKMDEVYLEVIEPALVKSKLTNRHVMSLMLSNKKIITGKQTDILSPACSLILNAIKELSKIPDDINLISPNVLEPMLEMKKRLGSEDDVLHLTEVITALSICSTTNPMVEKALSKLSKLKNCDAHATYIVSNGDKRALKGLGINFTCESEFITDVELDI